MEKDNSMIFPYHIPIVFAVDDNYLPYMSIALNSLVDRVSNCYKYNIFVMHLNIDLERLNRLKENIRNNNVTIEFINLNQYLKKIFKEYGNIFYERSYFTTAMYYRIFIPEIFSNFKKVIYCDSDVIFKADISHLFFIDLNNKEIGACRDIAALYAYRKRETVWQQNIRNNFDKINFRSISDYFNSGVIVFDIVKCIQMKTVSKCLTVIKNIDNLYFPDQDVLNIVFCGHVHFLPLEWNFLWTTYIEYKDNFMYLPKKIINEIYKAKTKPKIIHYISETKPWKDKNSFFVEWWKFPRKNLFYGEILCKKLMIQNSYVNLNQNNCIYVDILDYLLLLPYFNFDDLYKHIEQLYNLENFALYRKNAIIQAESYYKKKSFLLNIDEIYFFMPKKNAYIKNIEEQLIKQSAYVNRELYQILRFLKKLGKKIILIHNNVYSMKYIIDILQKNNIDFYENIYSYKDFHRKDYSNFLYFGKFLFETQNINQKEYRFRYVNPKDVFVKYNPKLCGIYRNESLESSIILGLYIKKWILSDKHIDNYWESFGYFYGGPLCYGLANFIYNEAVKNDLKEFI
ncbi:hypothetical protein DU024_08415, partial [Campylobacter jejuni]|nr:hypothetical protein [Campylobacter jejuni]